MFVFNTIFHSALPSGKGSSILSSVINSNSYPEVLREFKLKKIPNLSGIDCFESIGINGYFYNPINPSNPILHVKVYEPCGYEAEVYTKEYFVALPLKGN